MVTRALHPWICLGQKCLKLNTRGQLLLQIHSMVGLIWWSHWGEGLSLVFQSHSGSHCGSWGPHSRKCSSWLWKSVTRTMELPEASWWLCPQRTSWAERGPQGSSSAQWDLYFLLPGASSQWDIAAIFALCLSKSFSTCFHPSSGLCLFPLDWKVYKCLRFCCSNWAIAAVACVLG